MTVKELVEKLSMLPQDHRVLVRGCPKCGAESHAFGPQEWRGLCFFVDQEGTVFESAPGFVLVPIKEG